MGMRIMGNELAASYDELIKRKEYDMARRFLRDNKDSLKSLRGYYDALGHVTQMEKDMITEIDPSFSERLGIQIRILDEVIAESSSSE